METKGEQSIVAVLAPFDRGSVASPVVLHLQYMDVPMQYILSINFASLTMPASMRFQTTSFKVDPGHHH